MIFLPSFCLLPNFCLYLSRRNNFQIMILLHLLWLPIWHCSFLILFFSVLSYKQDGMGVVFYYFLFHWNYDQLIVFSFPTDLYNFCGFFSHYHERTYWWFRLLFTLVLRFFSIPVSLLVWGRYSLFCHFLRRIHSPGIHWALSLSQDTMSANGSICLWKVQKSSIFFHLKINISLY